MIFLCSIVGFNFVVGVSFIIYPESEVLQNMANDSRIVHKFFFLCRIRRDHFPHDKFIKKVRQVIWRFSLTIIPNFCQLDQALPHVVHHSAKEIHAHDTHSPVHQEQKLPNYIINNQFIPNIGLIPVFCPVVNHLGKELFLLGLHSLHDLFYRTVFVAFREELFHVISQLLQVLFLVILNNGLIFFSLHDQMFVVINTGVFDFIFLSIGVGLLHIFLQFRFFMLIFYVSIQSWMAQILFITVWTFKVSTFHVISLPPYPLLFAPAFFFCLPTDRLVRMLYILLVMVTIVLIIVLFILYMREIIDVLHLILSFYTIAIGVYVQWTLRVEELVSSMMAQGVAQTS